MLTKNTGVDMTLKNNKLDIRSLSDSDPSANASSRRSLLKKTGMLAPVVLSVTSRPVWAAGCSISGEMSGNLSNPSRNDCTGQATAKSPGYWHKWLEIHNILSILGCVLWSNLTDENKDVFRAFENYDNGEGTAINVLYNWSVAAAANTDARYDLLPTNYAATISNAGAAISDTSDQDTRHLVAAILSAAHPGIAFPYPGSEWTVQYILDKYLSADSEQLLSLIRSFYAGGHLEPIPGLNNMAIGMGIGSAEAAYYWAIDYLGFPDPRLTPACAVNEDPTAPPP
ncbi:MAG: hypothetical protein ACJAXM_001666 [Arenicella sp.]|jgi:hypothetical protein